MHLSRAGVLLRPKLFAGPVSSQLRFASNGNNAPDTEYGPEGGFSTPFWRNTLLLSLLAVSFYKWAPSRDEDAYMTRWIAHYSTPRETWARLNEKHMLQSQQITDDVVVQGKAARPAIIRYRYPQSLDQASPHLQAVGSVPDMSGITARTD